MNREEEDRIRQLLRQAMPPVKAEAEPAFDLWPRVRARMAAKTPQVPWYDWALAGGMAVLVLCFPGTIPLLLYYL